MTFSSPNDIIKSTHAIDAKGGRLPIGIPGRLQIGMHGRLRRYPQSRQRKEILQLQRSGISTASAELLLARMHAKIDQLRSERERLKREQPFKPRVLGGRSW